MQKALRSLELGYDGFDEQLTLPLTDDGHATSSPTSCAGRAPTGSCTWPMPSAPAGRSPQVFDATKIDPWFLAQIEDLVREEAQVREQGFDSSRACTPAGFETQGLLRCPHRPRWWRATSRPIRARRRKLGLHPVYKRVDTCAARVRHLHRLSLFDLRRGVRSRTHYPPQDHDSGRRTQSDRPGHRVRLLLRACGHGAARGRLRDHHGQLQSGDRLDRLRHLGPAVLRAADLRGRAWRSSRRRSPKG